MKGAPIEVSIHLRPLPSSHWLKHDHAFGTSIVSIEGEADKYPSPLTIIGVRLNGLPLRYRVIDSWTVAVTPQVAPEGGRLEVRCVRPLAPSESTPKPLQWLAPAYPTPKPSYGLTAPETPRAKHPYP